MLLKLSISFLKIEVASVEPGASGHTVHCLGHDSILGPAIGPFLPNYVALSIYMNDGEAIRIPFTTAQLFNHR